MNQRPDSRRFHMLVKPRGPICNLGCQYCFYLEHEQLYGKGSSFHMSDGLLDSFTRQYIEIQDGAGVTFSWQGGEPTLMGLDFFRRALSYQKKYSREGMNISNTLQTNGILLDDEFCRFLRESSFLTGLSLDGPGRLHDALRVDKGGNGTFELVHSSLRLLQKYEVELNILCVVSSVNAGHPLEVYDFFRNAGVKYIQFIPAVAASPDGGIREWTVRPGQWGDFLCRIFEEWIRHDVGEIFILNFESALEARAGLQVGNCVHAETCGSCLAMEHNGDVFLCDHFVSFEFFLGNLMTTPLSEIVSSPLRERFGLRKRDDLPPCCLSCKVYSACRGGCPKDRISEIPGSHQKLNYLCEGYRQFLEFSGGYAGRIVDLISTGRAPGLIMKMFEEEQTRKIGRNEPCICGSGKKYKKCCMRGGGF